MIGADASGTTRMRPFAVGITGHRLNKIRPESLPRIRAELASVFCLIHAACAQYASAEPGGRRTAPVTLLTSLAEGADQIAVQVRPEGWRVEAILPFPRARYAQDFEPAHATGGVDRRAEFELALAQAQAVVERDDETDPPRAYENAGRAVLAKCDVLVAVWDGMPEAGAGGTKAIVALAIEARLPVIWIRSDDTRPPALVCDSDAPETSGVPASASAIADIVAAAMTRPATFAAASHPSTPRDAHLFGPGQKRILSLDGGGVRGAATIAFLEQLEAQIAEIEGRPVRLGDWFDLIGGTSTGSIIAAALALGYRAAEVHDFYRKLAPSIFKRSYFRLLGWHAKFDSRNLMRELESIIGARTLDSADLITGLCIVLKRMDTGSAWIVMNNPRSAYWTTPADKSFIGNRHLPIANLVRASTAAPSYFDPELIEIAPGQPRGLFIDGGLTPHNNPALMLLLAACLPAYGLNWKLGPDNLLIVSIGTGSFRETLDPSRAMGLSALSLAIHSLAAMISESQQLVLTLMQYLGESPTAWPINSEIGNLGDTRAPTGDLFRFLRYDLRLEEKWLADELGEDLTGAALERLREMDQPANVPRLYELGRKAAAMQIKREHLETGALRAGGEGRAGAR
jgi:hypothetical protein